MTNQIREINELNDYEIILNQAETDINELTLDVKAGLYPIDRLTELITRTIAIGKKLGQAELLAKQFAESQKEEAKIENAS